MAALRTAVCLPPISIQAAQLALSVNIEAATATAMSDAAITGVVETTEREHRRTGHGVTGNRDSGAADRAGRTGAS